MNTLLKQARPSNNNNTDMDMKTALNSIKSNPCQFLQSSGYSIPNNLGNNPQLIAQYLLNSGQVSQQVIKQLMRRFGL